MPETDTRQATLNDCWLASVRIQLISIAESTPPLNDAQRMRLRQIFEDGLALVLHESSA
jgi:hypothetical protein